MEQENHKFVFVNVNDYVRKGIEAGAFTPRQAQKDAMIVARQGTVGEIVETYSVGGVLETVNTVESDPVTNQPDWIVTKVKNGEVVVDEFGHKNEWIVTDSDFHNKYEIDPNNPMFWNSKEAPQTFIQIPDDIAFVDPSGEPMNIVAGGYLNVTDCNEIYGVQERDFNDTYRFTDEQYQEQSGIKR